MDLYCYFVGPNIVRDKERKGRNTEQNKPAKILTPDRPVSAFNPRKNRRKFRCADNPTLNIPPMTKNNTSDLITKKQRTKGRQPVFSLRKAPLESKKTSKRLLLSPSREHHIQ